MSDADPRDADAAPVHELFSVEIQEALLGAIMTDHHALDMAAELLSPEDWYDPLHQRIYEMILVLRSEGSAVTSVILGSVMKGDAGLKEVGGVNYLKSIARATPALPNVKDYARIIRNFSLQRKGIEALHIASEEIGFPQASVSKALLPIMALVDEADRFSSRHVIISPSDSINASLKEIEERAKGNPPPAVPSGLALLDKKIGGLRGGELAVIPGRSGMGKSALLGGWAMRAAMAGYPTLVFSLEMKTRSWVERMACDYDFDTAKKPIWYSKFRTGSFEDGEFNRIHRAGLAFSGMPLEVDDTDGLTISQIESRARSFKAKHKGLGLIAIDYLQIVAPDGQRGRSREQEVTAIVRGAKGMAKRLNWAVLAGAQLLSKGDDRNAKPRKPTPNDIRESGAIEFEADIIVSPYREAWFLLQQKPNGLPDDPDVTEWGRKLAACINRMELLGLKFRHSAQFSVEVFCDMGASAIRDERPVRHSPGDELAYLPGLSG